MPDLDDLDVTDVSIPDGAPPESGPDAIADKANTDDDKTSFDLEPELTVPAPPDPLTAAQAQVRAAEAHATMAEAQVIELQGVVARQAEQVETLQAREAALDKHVQYLTGQIDGAYKHAAVADERYATLMRDLTTKASLWAVEVVAPRLKGDVGARPRMRLLVLAPDGDRAAVKAKHHSKGGDVITAMDTGQKLIFDGPLS